MSLKQHSPVYLSIRRLMWLGPLTVIVSIAAVLLVRVVAVAVLRPAPAFMPLRILPPILDTAVLVIWAVLVFAAMTRFVSDPLRKFKTVALAVLLLSFLPDIALAKLRLFGATWTYAAALMVMHVAAWATCVTTLTRLGPVHTVPSHMLEQDKRKAIKIIVEQKAEEQLPEDAAGGPMPK
jgi:hypothetical protein